MTLRTPTVVVSPTPTGTLVLMRWGQHERLKAFLPWTDWVHRDAAPLLLEGLADFCQRRLSVVLCVNGHPDSHALGLSNEAGVGVDTVHYAVEVVNLNHRGLRFHGIPGDFSRLRRFLPGRLG